MNRRYWSISQFPQSCTKPSTCCALQYSLSATNYKISQPQHFIMATKQFIKSFFFSSLYIIFLVCTHNNQKIASLYVNRVYSMKYVYHFLVVWYGVDILSTRSGFVCSISHDRPKCKWTSVWVNNSYEYTKNENIKKTWWRHQMETFSALLAICADNSPVSGEFSTQRPVTRSFDVFFDLRLNKRLSKQSWGWWFETLWRPLWRHRNDLRKYYILFHSEKKTS